MKKFFAASLFGLALASASQAAVLTYILSENDNGTGSYTAPNGNVRSYAVYAFTSAGDNSGIASYNFTVTGQSTTVNRAAQATFVDDNGIGDNKTSGYTLLRAGGGSGIATTGSFDTVSGNGLVVYGIGQRVGNVRTEGAPLAPPGYSPTSTPAQGAFGVANSFILPNFYGDFYGTGGQVPVLLATGTYATTDVFDRLSITFGLAALFNTSQDGSAFIPTIQAFTRGPLVPEPASLVGLGLTAVGLIARRRKA